MRKKWYLGTTKREFLGTAERMFLEDFEWECKWYWSGGIMTSKHSLFHFDGAFLKKPDERGHPLGRFVSPWAEKEKPAHGKYHIVDNGCCVWEPITTFLDDVPEHLIVNWWRIKDLFKQFYIYKEAAEAFQYGGHCTPIGRNPAEIKPVMARSINLHIEHVIIPEIQEIFNQEED